MQVCPKQAERDELREGMRERRFHIGERFGTCEAALERGEREPQEKEQQCTADPVQNRNDRRSGLANLEKVEVLRSRFRHRGAFWCFGGSASGHRRR
jgi:hypothetical protein